MEINITSKVIEVNQISQKEYNVAQINSIKSKYKELRNESKAPTFALT